MTTHACSAATNATSGLPNVISGAPNAPHGGPEMISGGTHATFGRPNGTSGGLNALFGGTNTQHANVSIRRRASGLMARNKIKCSQMLSAFAFLLAGSGLTTSSVAQITCGCTYIVAGTGQGPDGTTLVDIITLYNGNQTCNSLVLPQSVIAGNGVCPADGFCITRWIVSNPSCTGTFVTFRVSCGVEGQTPLPPAFVRGRGPSGGCADSYALTRGRVRGNGTSAKVQFRIRTKAVAVGRRGFLPGTVELFRWGLPSEQYRWRKAETNALVSDGTQPSGSFVSGATSAAMTITGIDTPDEGLYVLEAAACQGCFYFPVDAVRVYVDRPVADIVMMPQDREACLGGSTDFLVIADEPGGVPASYRWYRNGSPLNDGALSGVGTVAGATTPMLTISNLATGAAGNYACQILTGSYVNNTFDAALTISNNTTPPVVLAPPQSVSVNAGQSAYMIADIDVATGQVPSFQWRKNGMAIYDDGRIEGTQTEQIVFNNVNAGDAGSYDCIVTRGCASTTTSAATVTVTMPGSCDSIDFNNDGGFFDPQDIEAFLSVYAEGPCVPETATCNDIDFNNDGSLFDPCDVDAFLLVFSEGPCTLCGT